MSAATNKGLGRGLGALLPNVGPISEEIKGSIVELKINDISPNADQPRMAFDQAKLEDLANSIRENGVIQPIIVCRSQPGYKIVAGERRWRASRMAGLTVIPAIIRELTDVQVLEQALIENIQRQDLNPLEEAYALDKLLKDHNLTQEKLSATIGRSRPAIANTLRLLNLPEDIKQYIMNEELTAGHARALLALPDYQTQKKAADLIRSKELSVRETERLVKKMASPPKPVKKPDPAYSLSIKEVERRLTGALGTRVHLKDRQGKGTIQISYFSNEDLDRLLDLLERKQ
jgi:ParB family transcriptional regulator, chromosome partitioning protein